MTHDNPTFCAECERLAPSHVEIRTDTIGGVTLTDVPVRVCDGCGADRCDPALDDVTLERVYAATGRRPRP